MELFLLVWAVIATYAALYFRHYAWKAIANTESALESAEQAVAIAKALINKEVS